MLRFKLSERIADKEFRERRRLTVLEISEATGLAAKLAEHLPEGMDRIHFVSSGSEANDLAWRLATTVTGKVATLRGHSAWCASNQAPCRRSVHGPPSQMASASTSSSAAPMRRMRPVQPPGGSGATGTVTAGFPTRRRPR